jgi:hypothetical protein
VIDTASIGKKATVVTAAMGSLQYRQPFPKCSAERYERSLMGELEKHW